MVKLDFPDMKEYTIEELRPCAHCGNTFVNVYIDRFDISWIKCECGEKIEVDSSHCHDAECTNIFSALIRRWNGRYIPTKEE